MNREISTWRRIWALTLLGVLPVLSGAIPVLDMMVGDGRDAVESEHVPGTHGFAHDHSICIQQQANQWFAVDATPVFLVALAFALPELPYSNRYGTTPQLILPHSRAPPFA